MLTAITALARRETVASSCRPSIGSSKISSVDENELKRLLEANAVDTRRHFDVVAERVEKKVQLIAEAVAQLDEKLDRTSDGLEERIDRGFAETQAMIKFSHAELDRRVRALEDGLADLQARVERLETSMH